MSGDYFEITICVIIFDFALLFFSNYVLSNLITADLIYIKCNIKNKYLLSLINKKTIYHNTIFHLLAPFIGILSITIWVIYLFSIIFEDFPNIKLTFQISLIFNGILLILFIIAISILNLVFNSIKKKMITKEPNKYFELYFNYFGKYPDEYYGKKFSTLDMISYEYSYWLFNYGKESQNQKKVSSIEFIKYEDSSAKNNPKETNVLNPNGFTILESLSPDLFYSYTIILEQIGDFTNLTSDNILHLPLGSGIKISYSDNELFTVITLANINGEEYLFYGDYNIDLSLIYSFCFSKSTFKTWFDEFKELTNQYFEHKLD